MSRPRPLHLEGVTKRYGRVGALDGASLVAPAGQTTVVLGPSGCGKTTLLRVAAGLESPDAGRVLLGGEDITDVPVRSRSLGMVFQDGALYPHWSARRNVLSYFLFRRRPPEIDPEARRRFERTAEIMGVELERLFERRPAVLSPGERQRVALARCVTREPAYFLLDEPFAHLDQDSRRAYRVRLRRLLQAFSVTTLYVTHDQQEAPLLGERVAVMRAGRVVQSGSWVQLYREPRDLFVATFLAPDPVAPAMSLLDGDRVPWAPAGTTVGVRPEDCRLQGSGAPGPGLAGIEARVVDVVGVATRGARLLELQTAAGVLHAYQPEHLSVPDGPVWVVPARAHVFEREGGRTLEVLPRP